MEYKDGLQLLWSIPITIVLVLAGYLISHFLIGNPASLDLMLFVLGAILIFLYLPSLLSSSTSGALHTPKVIFRKVGSTNRVNDGKQVQKGGGVFAPKNLVLAGLLTWVVGFILVL